MFTIPDPAGLSWAQWAATVAGFNPLFSQYVSDQMDWSLYGQTLAYLAPTAPRVDLFESWQDWAVALRLALSS